jgi:Putative prokaryotic signal transducing protein
MSDGGPELVRLTIVPNEAEAEMIRGLLATEGIESMYRPTDFAAGALDGWAAGGAREVLVHANDLETARELIGPA